MNGQSLSAARLSDDNVTYSDREGAEVTSNKDSTRSREVIDQMLAEYLRTKWSSAHIAITVFMILGIFANSYAAYFLHRKRSKSMFTR